MTDLGLNCTGIDLSRFVTFTPAEQHQHRRWQVMGEPKPNSKGYSRFNYRVGTMLGTIALTGGGGYSVVLQFDDGEIESFRADILHAAEVGHG